MCFPETPATQRTNEVPCNHMWPRGSRHMRWPPAPSSRGCRWRCSSAQWSCRAAPTHQSQLRSKNIHIFMHICKGQFNSWRHEQSWLDVAGLCKYVRVTGHDCSALCRTQFDFSVLRKQNILPLNVPVDHMMGVEMGKTLEKGNTRTQSDDRHPLQLKTNLL